MEQKEVIKIYSYSESENTKLKNQGYFKSINLSIQTNIINSILHFGTTFESYYYIIFTK